MARTLELTVEERMASHPLMRDAMDEMVRQLGGEHPQPHTHSCNIKRRWWARLWFRFVRRWDWPLWEFDTIELACTGRVSTGGKIRFSQEFDPDRIAYKIVASRRWLCLDPIPQANSSNLIRYTATIISQHALDSYGG